MDNCSAHRGQKAAKHLCDKWPNAILVHTPVHASWLNQVENLFLDRSGGKSSPPTISLPSLSLNNAFSPFQRHYEQTAARFKCTFTRRDLHILLAKIAAKQLAPSA